MGRIAAIDIPGQDSPHTPRRVAEIIAFLQAGGRAVVVTGPPGAGKTALLAAVAASLPGPAIRVANPLVSPITLDRFLFQIGGHGDDGDDADAIIAHLAASLTPAAATTLVVDDAHTLRADVWPVMARVPVLHAAGGPAMNLVIAGPPDLLDAPDGEASRALPDPARIMTVSLPGVHQHQGTDAAPDRPYGSADARPSPPVVSASLPMPAPAARPAHPVRRRSLLVGIAVLAVIAVMLVSRPSPRPGEATAAPAVAAVLPDVAPPAEQALAQPPAPAPAPAPADATSPAGQQPPQTAASAPVLPPPGLSRLADAQLRSEFAAFLRRAGRDTAALSPAAREALFLEYLDWRDRNGAGPRRADAP